MEGKCKSNEIKMHFTLLAIYETYSDDNDDYDDDNDVDYGLASTLLAWFDLSTRIHAIRNC